MTAVISGLGRLSGNRSAVTKKLALLDDVHDFRRNHLLPTAIAGLQFCQHARGMNSQVLRMIVGNFLDVLIVDQILEQRSKVGCDLASLCGDDLSSRLVDNGLTLKFYFPFKN